MTYTSKDLLQRDDIKLTQGGLILIGVLRGGDYSKGLNGCGVTTAHGLAKCGFGDSLVRAARSLPRSELEDFLVGWREDIRAELRTNSRGHLQRKSPTLAKSIDEDFPDVEVLLSYTNPITSEEKGRGHKNAVVDWDKEPDLGRIAGLCEMYFEWGIKHIIIKRFRTVLWPFAVLRILRRAALLKDKHTRTAASVTNPILTTPRRNGKEQRAPPGTPSSMIAKHFSTMTLDSPRGGRRGIEDEDEERLIVKIHSSRQHVSTDEVLEYRLEIAPAQLVRLCEAGVKGLRTALPPDLSDEDEDDEDDEDGKKKGGKKAKNPPPDPMSHLRIWLPACMVKMVEPELVEEFEGTQRKKADKKAGKGRGTLAAGTKAKKLPAVAALIEKEESASESDDVRGPKAPVTVPPPKPPKKTQTKTTTASGSSQINGHFAAKKTTRAPAVTTKPTQATSDISRVASLFAANLDLEESADEGQLTSARVSRLPLQPTRRNTSANSPSKGGSSRLLGKIDSISAQLSPSKSRSSNPSPSSCKQRTLAPFPIDFEVLDRLYPSTLDEDTPPISTSSATTSLPSFRTSSPCTRPRSSLTSSDDSDDHRTALKKSPRRSEEHSSPHSTPSKSRVKAACVLPRKEEEEESSESESDARPPSPSPLKNPRALQILSPHSPRRPTNLARREEEEESDRAPSPLPTKPQPKFKPAAHGKHVKPRPVLKSAPFPQDMSIISISSGSEDEMPRRPMLTKKTAPLLAARANADLASQTSHASRKPPRRNYDPDDIIDLT